MKNDKITFDYCFRNFTRVSKIVINYIKTKTLNKKVKVILELLALVLFISIIHAPFGLIYDLVVNILNNRKMNNETFFKILYFGVNAIYFIFAVFIFVRIFVERYEKLDAPKEEVKNTEVPVEENEEKESTIND